MSKSKNLGLTENRIRYIEKMVTSEGNKLDPLMVFDKHQPEPEKQNGTEDIRELLPKKYIEFSKAIGELGGKLLYVKSGSTGHTFKGVYPPPNPENKQPYAVKIVAYPKKENYGDMYNVKRPENTELLMIKILSNFVIKGQTPHIILPITTFNTSIKPFLNLTKNNIVNNKKFEEFVKRYEKGEYYQNVSILISEWANGGDLLDYVREHNKTMNLDMWRTIFFQILAALAVIHAKYPAFRHNDMKANNILLQHIDTEEKRKAFLYKINHQAYEVPNIGFQVKLWDFDFSCIPGIVDNSKVEADWTTKINISPKGNRYYDIHYFFNGLGRKGFFPEFWTAPHIPKEVKEFVLRVVPPKYQSGEYVSDRGRLLADDEYLTADKILKEDQFFKIFRKV
jgi:serine/threonine protein kinase